MNRLAEDYIEQIEQRNCKVGRQYAKNTAAIENIAVVYQVVKSNPKT